MYSEQINVVRIIMKEFFRIALSIISIISFVFVLMFGITGIIYELLGHKNYEKCLRFLKFCGAWMCLDVYVRMCNNFYYLSFT